MKSNQYHSSNGIKMYNKEEKETKTNYYSKINVFPSETNFYTMETT